MGYNRNLITVQPLAAGGSGSAGGGAAEAAKWTIRAAIYTPRDTAVRPLLDDLAFSSLVVISSPFTLCFVLLVAWCIYSCIVACCCSGRVMKANSAEAATTPVARTPSQWAQIR